MRLTVILIVIFSVQAFASKGKVLSAQFQWKRHPLWK